MDLALNNLQKLICHKTHQTKLNLGPSAKWVECAPMFPETGIQSQVESYQRLKKMLLDTSLLNIQHYKVRIKGRVEQSSERSCALPYISV